MLFIDTLEKAADSVSEDSISKLFLLAVNYRPTVFVVINIVSV